jgi:uncharacterized RDD family membrane protein YckC
MNLPNPKQADPKYLAEHPGPSPGDLPGAGLFRQLLVMLYDAFIVFAVLMVAGAVALKLPFQKQAAGKDLAYTVYLMTAWFSYLAWCWRHGGMTLGMRAWRVRLLNTRAGCGGATPAWWQCLLRFIGGFLSALPAGMGYWWQMFDPDHRSWHDRLSQTRLVYLEKARPASGRAPQEIKRSNSQ